MPKAVAKKKSNSANYLLIALATGVVAFAVDKLAQYAYQNGLTFTGFILRFDLQFLPGLVALLVVGSLFHSSLKSQLVGVITSVAVAMVMFFLVLQLVAATGWYSLVWQSVGYQTAYLFVPSFLAVLIGCFVAQRVK